MHKLHIYILTLILCAEMAVAQKAVPSVSTEKTNLFIYVEGEKGNFPHQEFQSPFRYTLAINAVDTISVVSETDSIAFAVEPSMTMVFDVIRQQGQDTLHCFISLIEKQDHASFSVAYQRSHRGKPFVEVPKVYELVNVVYALTSMGRTDDDIVRKDTPYHDEVMTYFEKYNQEPVINTFDSLLRTDNYHDLKMDAYAFNMIGKNDIEDSDIYHIVSWGDVNTLKPYIAELEAFAKKTDFLNFYTNHQSLYEEQIKTYQDTINTNAMRLWLEHHFPDTKYDAFKIIFSPLVSGNQSSCNIDNNGFKELQAHVNYPYAGAWVRRYSPEVATLIRGDIVFTELNHGYINPESDKYDTVEDALGDLDRWIDTDKPAGNYNSSYACFNEYMNWALVSLRYTDFVQGEDLSNLLTGVEQMMVNNRGFKKFSEFNQFLVKQYQNREEDEVLADLYPQIITWFSEN